jgi:hypothetical protein
MGFTGRLHTACSERVNLTVRHGIAALARRTWATAKPAPHLLAHLACWRAGAPTLISCVPMQLCEWHWSNHKHEGATGWLNATSSELRRWQPAEPIEDGQRARCSLVPFRPFPLESQGNHVQVRCHVASMSVKLPAEALAWSLTLGKQGLSGLPQHQTPARCGFTEGWSMYPPYPIGVPSVASGTPMQ